MRTIRNNTARKPFTRMTITSYFMSGCVAALWMALAPLAYAKSIEASPDKDMEEVVATGRYLYSDQVKALKTPTPIIDVPQSLSITTAEQIIEQGFDSIGDVVLYTPGLNQSQGEGHRDAVVFRGVRSTADFFIDGVRDDVQYYRSFYNLEQVEVLRGPNALLFGRGGTGGLLNRVTKKGELGRNFAGYKTSVDTFGAFDVSGDLNYAINDTVSVRLNANYESLNNHRDFFDGDRFAINPTLRWEATPSTTVDLSYEYVDNERFIDRGIPSAAPDGTTSTASGLRTPVEALSDITFGDEDLNTATLQAHILRANISHQFTDSIKGNFTAAYADYDKLYQNLFPVGFNAANPDFDGIATVDLDGYVDTTERQNLTLSGNFVGEFETANIGHTIIAGLEYLDTKNDNDRFNTFFDSSQDDVETFAADHPINILNGVGVNAAGVTTTNDFSVDVNDDDDADLNVFSAFIQDEISVTDWLDIIVGARFDSFDFTVENTLAALDDPDRTLSSTDTEISPRFGVILKPKENISLYGSFSESFIPQSGEQFAEISSAEAAITPDVAQNLEAGIKWDILPALSFTAAIFEIETTAGIPTGDSDNQVIESLVRVQGLEASVSGNVTDHFNVTAGVSFLNGDIIEGGDKVDSEPRELPGFTASAWGKYDFTDRFGLGLGVTHQDDSFADGNNTTVLPSFTRVDAAAYYDVNEDFRLQVNVENLTDTEYFPNAHTDDQITVGAPINAKFTISGRF